MKTLIVYASTYGCAKSISEKMGEELEGEVALLNLKHQNIPDIQDYDRIIIGSSAKGGRIQKSIYNFCCDHIDELKQVIIGLFVCCSEINEKDAINNLEAYPEQLLIVAQSTAVFKGNHNFEMMNFMERLIIKNINRLKYKPVKVDYEAVQHFSRRMDRIFNPFLFVV